MNVLRPQHPRSVFHRRDLAFRLAYLIERFWHRQYEGCIRTEGSRRALAVPETKFAEVRKNWNRADNLRVRRYYEWTGYDYRNREVPSEIA